MNENDKFKRAVQALAQPANVQIELFPDFVVIGDELAIEFDKALRHFMPISGQTLTDRQRASIEAVNRELERSSGPAETEFWLNSTSLFIDPSWDNLRRLAATVLHEMGWSNVRPEPSGAIYVGSKD